MNVEFASAAPTGAELTAHIVNRGSLPGNLDDALAQGTQAARFTGKTGQVFEGYGSSGRVALAGSGAADAKGDARIANLEKAGAALATKFAFSGVETMVLDLASAELDADGAAAVLFGLRLRSWRYDVYRTKLKDEEKRTLNSVVVLNAPEGTSESWETASAVADGVEFTRELVTEPANIVYPVSFVERCQERMAKLGVEITVLDEAEMAELGMGALLGVGLGSARESRLIAMRWNGGEKGERPTVFVGKGVTFDTGGISLKPGPGMEDMKWDMGGAGAVAGAMLAMAGRKAKANVIGVCGLVENMPDGKAQRPGDVVTSMDGQTIEILNTDAEGRLVLCDALHWAQKEYDPVAVVDFATLTGAIIISLGNEHGGVFANDDTLADSLLEAGKGSGDKLWRMPIGPAYDKLIDSPIADVKNVGPRQAGSITAAQFLHRFIDKDRPWAHCDIAGMVWSDKPGATWGKGATGYGVRLIDRYVRNTLEG